MNSESELFKALAALAEQKNVDPIIEYRLHYNDSGDIVSCSMRDPHPESTQYIVVTKEQYDNYFRYKVVNKQLQLIVHSIGVKNCLYRSLNAGFKVIAGHPAILVEENEVYQNVEYYEYRNN